jgi:hypothetical protein
MAWGLCSCGPLALLTFAEVVAVGEVMFICQCCRYLFTVVGIMVGAC